MVKKRPQPRLMVIQLSAGAHHLRLTAELTAQQQAFHHTAGRCQFLFQCRAAECAVPTTRPLAKQLPHRTQETVAPRVPRQANTVKQAPTNVHSQAFALASLVGDSSMPRYGCVGSSLTSS